MCNGDSRFPGRLQAMADVHELAARIMGINPDTEDNPAVQVNIQSNLSELAGIF